MPPAARIDDKDRLLLSLLIEDANRPLKTLASKVGLSRSSVRDRLSRMEANGTIRRYTIEIAPEPERVRAILLLRLDRTPDPSVVGAVTGLPEVIRCYSLSGPIDLLVELAADDVERLNRARDQIATLAGVADVETSLVLNLDKAPGGQ